MTTMLELYDTQMLDYPGDIDVPMHSTPDPWFHDEATMEEDSHILQKNHVGNDSTVSVEVDMEPEFYDGGNVEYEMVDEAGNYQSEELVDVEVHDASQAHTPQLPVSDLDVTHFRLQSESNHYAHQSSAFSESLPVDSLHSSANEHLLFQDPVPENNHGGPTGLPVIEEPSFHSDFHPEGVENVTAAAVGLTATLQLDPSASTTDAALNSAKVADVSGPTSDLEPEASPMANYVEPPADDEEHATISTHTENPEPLHLEIPHESPATNDERPEEHYDEAYNQVTNIEVKKDPHEISEGVYIDPPPAVLVSLPLSERPELCLFNRPLSSRSSASPSPEGEQTQSTLILLLHDRPTLYYEPLSTVFEALRQDTSISSIPEISDGELVLNAYDLQLVISEDNLYAREVTLHDLNVLHDGSDIAGPLRLRLQSIVPRFIVRYHLLQDQISRLNFVTEGGEVYGAEDHQLEDHLELEERYDGPETTLEVPQEGLSEEQQGQQSSDPTEAQNDPNIEAVDSAENTEEVTDLPDATGEQYEYNDGQAEPTHTVSDGATEDSDSTDQHPTNDSGPSLGADAVHESADSGDVPAVEEYTEYDEYAAPQEDDDGNYGEVLIEDAGEGETTHPDIGDIHDSPESLSPLLEDTFAESNTPHLAESDLPAEELAKQNIGEDHTEFDDNGNLEEITYDEFHPDDHPESNPPGSDSKVADESDSNFIATIEHDADLTDNVLDPSSSELQVHRNVTLEETEQPYDEEYWDDNLDGEGDPDIYEYENDAESNQSSVTLSSKTSSKRHFDEVELDDEDEAQERSPPASPGPKRPRVQ